MGNSPPPKDPQIISLKKQFKQIKTLPDPRTENVKILKNRTNGELCWLKNYQFINESEKEEFLDYLEIRKKNDKLENCVILNFSYIEKSFCTTLFCETVLVKKFENNVFLKIKKKKSIFKDILEKLENGKIEDTGFRVRRNTGINKNEFFDKIPNQKINLINNPEKTQKSQNPEQFEKFSKIKIISIIQSLVKHYKKLLSLNIFDDYIQPEHLQITENGKIKILDFSIISYQISALEKTKIYLYEKKKNLVISPFSPEQIANLENFESLRYSIDFSKIAGWTIGMVLLCFLSLEDFWVFYELDKSIISFKKIKSKIFFCKSLGYDDVFVKLIEECLQYSPERRFGIEQIEKYCEEFFFFED